MCSAIQLANGGGTFEPLRPADPCARADCHLADRRHRLASPSGSCCSVSTAPPAACTSAAKRSRLRLAQPGTRTNAEIHALRAGLLSAVRQMKDDGSLPPASELVDEALDSADLNVFLKAAIRALPDSVVNAALKTDDVLTRTIDDLDLRALLANLDNQHDLDQQINAAVTQAVKDSLADRLRGLL